MELGEWDSGIVTCNPSTEFTKCSNAKTFERLKVKRLKDFIYQKILRDLKV